MAARPRRLQWEPEPPRVIAALLLFLHLLAAAGGAAAAAASAAPAAGRREAVTSPHGAVAADDWRCSRIGRDALREGGSAVDAAVASALCLGVVSPASSGVGGGAFMLVRLADGTAVVYDSRETAPLAASKDSSTAEIEIRSQEKLFVKGYGKAIMPNIIRLASRLGS
ncbi:unnamed protein product [Miscanthus lutarioriparius]|uniref:Uncharacterized protein n=1 Tax=Miscanthus lutarioriparius TaxID=422564 RepID=A0A811SID2_9POAL|nr:unnamed protein product [Miscanthus lutarioriparius]